MGSYLMACAVSGATITEQAEVVAFRMQREEQAGRGPSSVFNREWFISDFPQHGVYNDYGNVLLPDGSEISSSGEDVMIMYKWAWQVLVDLVKDYEKEEDASYEEYSRQGLGYTNYRLKHIANAKAAIDEHISIGVAGPISLSDIAAELPTATKERAAQLMALVLSHGNAYRTEQHLRWGGEGCMTSDDFWREMILTSDDPHATHDRFREEVLVISKATNHIYFRLYPSMYGSQESNAREMIKLYERGLEYFREHVKGWDEE